MTEQDMLLAQLDRYWECFNCGRVINDPNLAKVLGTTGTGWGLGVPCPKCGGTASKSKFPDKRFRPLFEMMIECYQTDRAILVLILAQTAFEGMFDDFLRRLLRRMNCPEDVELAITYALNSFNAKTRFIKSLTGKKIAKIIEDVGFKDIMRQFETIRTKRNSFLHTAGEKDLTLDDIKEALKFACATVDLYAALFSEYREWRPLVEPDENHPF
jgi:hypothetical protein